MTAVQLTPNSAPSAMAAERGSRRPSNSCHLERQASRGMRKWITNALMSRSRPSPSAPTIHSSE